jgi:hypothetical protein
MCLSLQAACVGHCVQLATALHCDVTSAMYAMYVVEPCAHAASFRDADLLELAYHHRLWNRAADAIQHRIHGEGC